MAVLHEQGALEELSALSSPTTSSGDQGALVSIHDLRHDLKDPEEAVAANLPSFERKLEILQRQIVDETEKVVVRESDRVIEAVIAGPHDRLLDKVGAVVTSVRSGAAHLTFPRISMLSGKKWYDAFEERCAAVH